MLESARPTAFAASDDFCYSMCASAYRAYGDAYPFCAFFQSTSEDCTVLLHIFNSTAYVASSAELNPAQAQEIAAFLILNAPTHVYISPPAFNSISKLLKSAYSCRERHCFEVQPIPSNDLDSAPPLDSVYHVLSESFCGLDYQLWLTDTSHRIRHGEAICFMYKHAAVAFAVYKKPFVYLSEVAVLPDFRGKGFGRELIGAIASEYQNTPVRLFCQSELRGFYLKSGCRELYKEKYMEIE